MNGNDFKSSTSRGQRIALWTIAIFMVIGTIGSFAVIVVANENAQRDQQRLNELTAEYQADQAAYQEKLDAQTAELSEKYYDEFSQYSSRVGEFDADAVTELKTEDLKVGDGEEITEESSFTAYYIGWNPWGTIFDQSIDGDSLKAPISVTPGGVIDGWTQGLAGMKVGGVRELTIPSDLAYGAAGSGDDIPADTPLKFVVMIIPTPEAIPQPDVSEELLNYYSTGSF